MRSVTCAKQPRASGAVWTARWSLTLPDGTRRWGRVTEATKRDCEAEARDAMEVARHGGQSKPEMLTVADWLADWMAGHARTVRPQTMERYASALRRHVVPYLGQVRLQKLGERDLRAWLTALDRNGVSPGMADYAQRILAVALNRAVAQGLLDRSPLKNIERARVEDAPAEAYNADEVAAIYAVAKPGEECFIVAISQGLRRGELLGLKWEDIDFDRGRLHVRRQLVRVGGQLVEANPKTKRSVRSLVLTERSREALRRRRVAQIEDRLQAGSRWHDRDYVFTDRFGHPWSLHQYQATWQWLVARAGVRYLEPHACRHTFATLALAAGVHPLLVKEALGHATIAMTLDQYSHVSEELQREAAAKVEALLQSASPPASSSASS
jgi:integrase